MIFWQARKLRWIVCLSIPPKWSVQFETALSHEDVSARCAIQSKLQYTYVSARFGMRFRPFSDLQSLFFLRWVMRNGKCTTYLNPAFYNLFTLFIQVIIKIFILLRICKEWSSFFCAWKHTPPAHHSPVISNHRGVEPCSRAETTPTISATLSLSTTVKL